MVLVLQIARTEVLLLLAAQNWGGENRDEKEKTSGLTGQKHEGPRPFKAQGKPELQEP